MSGDTLSPERRAMLKTHMLEMHRSRSNRIIVQCSECGFVYGRDKEKVCKPRNWKKQRKHEH